MKALDSQEGKYLFLVYLKLAGREHLGRPDIPRRSLKHVWTHDCYNVSAGEARTEQSWHFLVE